MKPCVVEVMGCPGAGKTTLAGRVAERLAAAGMRTVLLNQKTLASEQARRQTLGAGDVLRSRAAVWGFLLQRAGGLGALRPGGAAWSAAWRRWSERVRKEWLNSLAYRRHWARSSAGCDALVSDSRFAGKLLYEAADPRSAAGGDPLDLLLRLAVKLPETAIDLAVVVSVPPEVAMQREAGRTANRVRPDLDEAGRAAFFRAAGELSRRMIPALQRHGLARGGIEVSGLPEAAAESVERVAAACLAARSATAAQGGEEKGEA